MSIHAHKLANELLLRGTQVHNRMAVNISKSQKFLLEFDLNTRLTEFGAELIGMNLLRLPFSICYFECPLYIDEFEYSGFIAEQHKEAISVQHFTKLRHAEVHSLLSFAIVFNRNASSDGFRRVECGSDLGKLYPFHEFVQVRNRPEVSDEVYLRLASDLAGSVAALSSKSISAIDVQAPVALNKQRERRKKIPIFSYKKLVLDLSVSSDGNPGLGGSHASPALHWRRGHIRTLRKGRETPIQIPVSPCIVGAAEDGIVMKEYRARFSAACAGAEN